MTVSLPPITAASMNCTFVEHETTVGPWAEHPAPGVVPEVESTVSSPNWSSGKRAHRLLSLSKSSWLQEFEPKRHGV